MASNILPSTELADWIERVDGLIAMVKQWATELDWSTKIVDKKMQDPVDGEYRIHCLVLQMESVKLFLEPIARDVPGTEGVVDLCLMPSYDDIASIYFIQSNWQLHYRFEGAAAPKSLHRKELLLTKENLNLVFEQMVSNAR